MYNTHRGMMPQHSGMPPGNRIPELLEQIRIEFESQSGRAAGEYEQQRESMLRQQMDEMQLVQNKVRQLEEAHAQIKADYERRIDQLQREVDMRSGQPHPAAHHPPQPQPPSIGHGPRDLFGQIMAGGGGQGQSSLAPPPQEPPQPQGLPAHLTQGSGLSTGPQPPQHQPYPGYGQPGVNGYAPQPPQLNQSPGPNKTRGRGPPGTSTPQQSQPPLPYPPASPRGHAPTPPPGQRGPPAPPPQHYQIPNVGNELSKLQLEDLPPQFKKTTEEWWAIYNPQVQRQLDVKLLHTLNHNSVVCCVRFSVDGRYVATGCNRAAQIYDVERGAMVAHLEEDTPDKEGDLYIRSVCFSPDGKYLATGAEDKAIRVWDIAERKIIHTFTGHEQDIYSLDFARNGRLIASGSGDRTVRLWDLETRRGVLTLSIEEGVTTVALSPNGRLVAAGSLDRSVRVWDTENGMKIDTLEGPSPGTGHADSVYSVAFSPSGNELVSGSLDKTIKMWQLSPPPQPGHTGPPPKQVGRCIRTFEGHSDFVLSVALTPDGNWVLSGSKDRGVVFWDPHTGVAHLHLQGHRNSVISVAPSPKVGLFATGSGDSRARIWSYEPYRG